MKVYINIKTNNKNRKLIAQRYFQTLSVVLGHLTQPSYGSEGQECCSRYWLFTGRAATPKSVSKLQHLQKSEYLPYVINPFVHIIYFRQGRQIHCPFIPTSEQTILIYLFIWKKLQNSTILLPKLLPSSFLGLRHRE